MINRCEDVPERTLGHILGDFISSKPWGNRGNNTFTDSRILEFCQDFSRLKNIADALDLTMVDLFTVSETSGMKIRLWSGATIHQAGELSLE
jgi:hypothetical protein